MLRPTLTFLLLSMLAGCDSADFGDGGEGGLGPGGTTSTGPGDTSGAGASPANDDVVTQDDGNTSSSSAASGSSSSGGASLIDVCGQALTPSTINVSVHGNPSTAGAQYARASLQATPPVQPDPVHLRSEEFLAYYGVSAATASEVMAEPVSLRWFQVGDASSVQGALELDLLVPPRQRDPLRVVALVDVSSSASSGLPLAQASILALARGMAADGVAGDSLAVLTFAGDVRVEVDGPVAPDTPYGGLPVEAISLVARSGNDFRAGIKAGIDAAGATGPIGHIVLITDGGASADSGLLDTIRAAAAGGTRLSVAQIAADLPTGPAPLASALIDDVSAAGRGPRFYVAAVEDADRVFDARFGATFGIHATSVVANIQLPPLLRAVGLPTASVDGAVLPGGGTIGSNSVTPHHVRLEAVCSAVFTTELPTEFIDVQVAGVVAGEPMLLGTYHKNWLGLRGHDALTRRNDGILAAAQAMRSRSPSDVAVAVELLDGLIGQGSQCLDCEAIIELRALLDAIAP